MATQSLRLTSEVPPWLARTPLSATLRNIEALGSLSMPSLSVPDVQKRRSTVRACDRILDWSKYFVKKMNQLPTDMIRRRPRTVFDTMPPRCATSTSLYGFSCEAAPPGGFGAGVLIAGAAGAGAPGVAAPGAAGAAVVGAGVV